MQFIVQIIISTLAVLISAYFLSGVEIHENSFGTAVIVASVISFLNAVVKPIMILLTIPITLMTMGIFLLAINAFVIQLTANLVDGFSVNGFWSALWFSLILSIVTSILEGIKKKDEQKQKKQNDRFRKI